MRDLKDIIHMNEEAAKAELAECDRVSITSGRVRVVPTDQVDILDLIMGYEDGDLDEEETIVLFQRLVNSGMAWTLQGAYGRTANMLIEAGLITDMGVIE